MNHRTGYCSQYQFCSWFLIGRFGPLVVLWVWLSLALVPQSTQAKPPPYHSHESLNDRLETLAQNHAQFARVTIIAKTPKKRAILALEVDLTGQFDPKTPYLLLHGGIHGNEWMSVEVVLHLAELTLADPGLLPKNLRYHFVPAVNGDGFQRSTRHDFDPLGKKYDMNRNFPVPFQPDFPSHPVIQEFRNYAKRGRLAGVLDYHTAVQCFSWPWAFSRESAAHVSAALKDVVKEMASAVGYGYGQTSKIISYPHEGTAQDYFAYVHKVPAILMELGPIYGVDVDYAPQQLIDQERPFIIFSRWLNSRVSGDK